MKEAIAGVTEEWLRGLDGQIIIISPYSWKIRYVMVMAHMFKVKIN